MKVEIDLSAEQLAYLDRDLTGFIKSMNDEQKLEILKGYMLQNLKFEKSSSSYYNNKQLTEFAQEVVNGLKAKICDSITKDILEDENLKKAMHEVVEDVKKDLGRTIQAGIMEYIISNLFNSKDDIKQTIYPEIWQTINNHVAQYHNRY